MTLVPSLGTRQRQATEDDASVTGTLTVFTDAIEGDSATQLHNYVRVEQRHLRLSPTPLEHGRTYQTYQL